MFIKKKLFLFFIFMFVFPVLAGAQEYVLVNMLGSYGDGPGEFDYPRGIAVDNYGNVYVADSYNHRIQKFSSDGSFITMWGSYGTGPGEFLRPRDIAVDKNGNVYVVDDGADGSIYNPILNHRIQKFFSDGSFITMWRSYGDGPGEFDYPHGIAVDNYGNVYVKDTRNHRIQKFTSDGEFITMWGSSGTEPGEYNCPEGIAVDKNGNVYVADTYNDSIQKFSPITLGDCNGDGKVSIDEVQKCINCLLGILNECCIKCDRDGSGQVTIDEVQRVINGFLEID